MIWHRFSGGVQSKVVGEGTHFRIPLVTYPTIFDVRLKPRVIASRTGTKDLQQVQISLRVLSRPDSERLPEIFRNLGERLPIIPPTTLPTRHLQLGEPRTTLQS